MTDWGTSTISRHLAAAHRGLDKAVAGLADAAEYAKQARNRMLRAPQHRLCHRFVRRCSRRVVPVNQRQ